MRKDRFEDALGELISRYSDAPLDEVISALELQLMGLREQQAELGEQQ